LGGKNHTRVEPDIGGKGGSYGEGGRPDGKKNSQPRRLEQKKNLVLNQPLEKMGFPGQNVRFPLKNNKKCSKKKEAFQRKRGKGVGDSEVSKRTVTERPSKGALIKPAKEREKKGEDKVQQKG